MIQLELPLKFKPNTYESYTDAQKKEHWYANYCIKMMEMQKIERNIDKAVRLLKEEADLLDRQSTFRSKMARRIREICDDILLKDKK